jgi:hypothetical protein
VPVIATLCLSARVIIQMRARVPKPLRGSIERRFANLTALPNKDSSKQTAGVSCLSLGNGESVRPLRLLGGREQEIQAERDRKLEAATEQRKNRRQRAA